ncbi:MAG: transcription termination/antitermination protein NusA [Ruminococcaceae bacterium]|nr:transcription termination/antitermination protein NusA [Oscillospiraceae bacterium]
MNSEFFTALELLEKEKGIPQSYMIEKIEAALLAAFKKEYGANALMRADYDFAKRKMKIYQRREVVEEVVDPTCQISLPDAKNISRRHVLGGFVDKEVKTDAFRRISAAAGKSVIIQAIREGERIAMQEAYSNKKEELMTATVSKTDRDDGGVILELDQGTNLLTKPEQIPGEILTVGQKVKVFVTEINKEARGPIVSLSRIHPKLVWRLFELEVPEIQDGIVIIKGVSREAGSRSKIAVYSRDPDVDAVGACIGTRNMRLDAVISEINGEKIDIVTYSETPEEYIAAALAPASVISVEMTGERSCKVIVAPEQLSLAIGREGQNVRLAARLTGYKIDIKAEGSEY